MLTLGNSLGMIPDNTSSYLIANAFIATVGR